MNIIPDEVDDRWATPPARTQFYGFCAFPYENMYLGFLWLYRSMPTPLDPEGYMDGTIYIELASSRDGIHWNRIGGDRSPLLALGAEGSWDSGMIVTTTHPLVENDKIRLYYGGFSNTHYAPGSEWTSAVGLAFLRKDGFVSLDSQDQEGIITTKTFEGAEGRLRVNANTMKGSLRVELLDADGNVIDGYEKDNCTPLQVDSVDKHVTWKDKNLLPSDVSSIRLRFYIQNGSLYSFTMGEGARVAAWSK